MNRLANISNHLKSNQEIESESKLPYKINKNLKFYKKTTLKGKTIVITGASRGIGLAIAKRAAQDGANIAILAKTDVENPKLPGTIYSAAKEIEQLGGQALPIKCDIRDDVQVKDAIEQVIQKFGGIDILVNNASAINLSSIEQIDMKRYDLMHSINTRGTFLLSKLCMPYLKKSENPHILVLSPPLNMDRKWFAPHLAYTMAKYGMSMCVLGMSKEYEEDGIAVNALWPRTMVATAAVANLLGGGKSIRHSRKDTIVSDAAYYILTSDSKKTTGNFYIDDEVLASNGVQDFSQYRISQDVKEEELYLDGFL